jgi:adenylyltransferase/sulfurtransferase
MQRHPNAPERTPRATCCEAPTRAMRPHAAQPSVSDVEPCVDASCGSCTALAAQVAALRAENERLRLQLDRLHLSTASTAAASSLEPSPQCTAPPPSDVSVVGAFSRAEMQRYSRQMLVKEFGAAAQQRLRDARVLVIGAGGLGSPVALYLAAMGVGKLSIIDDDRVDSSNLHRQVLHDESQLHELKARSAQRRLRLINPLVQCEPIAARFSASNAAQLVARHDVVIDASDNVGTRYLANDACAAAAKPLVSGSAIGMEGQVTVFTYRHSTGCYRCLYPSPPRSQPMSCAENGVIGVVPGVIGCMQAMEAVKLITGVGEPLVGVQCLYDAYDGQFRRLKLPSHRRPECPACGTSAASPVKSDERSSSAPVDLQLFYEGGGSCGDYEVEAVAAASRLVAHQRISIEDYAAIRRAKAIELPVTSKKDNYILLDVRPKTQFDMVHFFEAIHVPFQHFTSQKPSVDALARMLEAVQIDTPKSEKGDAASTKIPTVYVICRRGIDSVAATEWLLQSGVECALNVDGGYTAYAARVDPAFSIY